MSCAGPKSLPIYSFNTLIIPIFWGCSYNQFYYNWATTRQNMSSGVSDQARHKPACAATEAIWSLEISAIESRAIILSKQRTTKAMIRLRGCAGWSAPLLFAYDIRHIFSWSGSIPFPSTPFSILYWRSNGDWYHISLYNGCLLRWCLEQDVEFDCIGSWSLPFHLLCVRLCMAELF